MLELIFASCVLGNAVQLLKAFVPSQEVNNQVSSNFGHAQLLVDV